jgi:5-methylcytosine-specific restriction endonuclease McrA
MARKEIPTSRRAAIWRAHERRCIYCTELVTFCDLDIDHIIPRSLLNCQQELVRLKKDYGLSKTFDIDGLGNLVPSHRHCNLQKHGQVLPKNRALHFLSIAEAKAAKAQKIETEIRRQMERNAVFSQVKPPPVVPI